MISELIREELRERLAALPVGSTRKDIEAAVVDIMRRATDAQIVVEIDPDDLNRINVLMPKL
jgi:hypothetical protein